jgi:hypothetical protein
VRFSPHTAPDLMGFHPRIYIAHSFICNDELYRGKIGEEPVSFLDSNYYGSHLRDAVQSFPRYVNIDCRDDIGNYFF